MTRPRRAAPGATAVAAAALLLAGCGSAGDGAGGDGAVAAVASSPSPASPSASAPSAGGPSALPASSPAAGTPGASTATPPASPSRSALKVSAFGDSVMLGARTCLEARGVRTDAKESRSFGNGLHAVRVEEQRGRLAPLVVLHLGTNGPFSASAFDEVMDVVGPDRQVWWLTVELPDVDRYDYAERNNAVLAAGVAGHSNAHLLDWSALARAHPDWLYGDGTHLTPTGCQGYAAVVDAAVRGA